jgi:hypothetical protein
VDECKPLVRGADPSNVARVIVRLADGTEVSVKGENYRVI